MLSRSALTVPKTDQPFNKQAFLTFIPTFSVTTAILPVIGQPTNSISYEYKNDVYPVFLVTEMAFTFLRKSV